MIANLYFRKEDLPAGLDTIRVFTRRGEESIFDKQFSNPSEKELEEFVKLNKLKLHQIKLTEEAYLFDDAIIPSRGEFKRGSSSGVADTYLKIVRDERDEKAYALWKFIIFGDKIQSAFELYNRIRSGEEKPVKSWDKKPVETKET